METLPTFNNLKSLSHQLSVQIEDLRVLDNNDLRARRKATVTARRLLDELIHPEEAAAEQIITVHFTSIHSHYSNLTATIQLSEWASIRMFMKWKFFDRIPLKGSISYEELAASIGAEEALVSRSTTPSFTSRDLLTPPKVRMGQMLVSTGKLLQPAPNHVAHSRLSPSYKTGDRNGYSFAMHHDDFQPVLSSLPAYFDKYGSRLPKGKTEIPMSFAAGADGRLTPWEIFARQGKEHLEQFGFAMQAMPNYAWPFTGAYDFSWVEEYASADPERLLIVDVGGSYGHALRANLVKYQGIPRSRCVVEDRSEMIPNIREAHAGDEVMRDVRKVAANFHDEQPVKGKQ